ncbi:LysR family transcriptional regulator [Rhizobium puerariae]|uniref:LysR family transcriptional regulator n=1 Tax=Rhizobium puerariae TaxID=1585791 RepID=A0ABV6AIZ0_9HYPH
MPLDLRQLRYFVAVAEAGAFTHAAQTLNVAQSALSHHLRIMEEELGTPLLERRARGVVLTSAGQRLYEHSKAILSSVKKAEADIKTFSEVPTGTVSIGFAHTAVDLVVLPFILAVREQLPGIILHISEGLSITNVNKVLSGDIDIAVAYNTIEDARLSSRPLLTEEMCLVGKPDIVGKDREPIAFSDLPKQPIIAAYPAGSLRAIVDSHALRSKVKPSEMLEIDSLATLRKAMQHGIGCSILSRASVSEQLRVGTLSARPIVSPELFRTLEQVSLKERPHSRAFEEVAKVLTSVILNQAQLGHWICRDVFPTPPRRQLSTDNKPSG